MLQSIIASLFFLSVSFNVLACLSSAPRSINLVSEYDNNGVTFYNNEKLLKGTPVITTRECYKSAASKQFFMIALALKNQILSDDFSEYSLNDIASTSGDACWLKRSPFKPMPKSERSEWLFKRRKVVDQCLRIQVRDQSKKGIRFVDGTKKCQSKKLSDNVVEVQGAYCFFKPHFDSRFQVSLHINPNCHDPSFLKENRIQPQDIFSVINTYVSSNASDKIDNLTALSSTDFRMSINPPSDIIETSEDLGTGAPLWPTSWEGMDVEIGEIKINGKNSHTDKVNTSFVVNTRCDSKCNDKGVCSSKCNYATPIIGKVTLLGLEGKQFHYLSSWYDGSIALPQWQGIISGLGHEIPKGLLVTGKTYKLEVLFEEPGIAFQKFSGKVFSKINLKHEGLGTIDREAGKIGTTPLLRNLRDLNKIPTIPQNNSLSFEAGASSKSFTVAVESLANYLNNRFWPPFYEKVCSGQNGECENASSGYIKYQVLFTVGEKSSNGKFEVLNKFIKKESNTVNSYKAKHHKPAQLRCKGNGRVFDKSDDEEDEDLGL